MTKQQEPFVPRNEGEVGLYVCGLTVYDRAHIGHGRMFVVFDVIRRALESKGYKVRHICNHTDVDDKIIKRANERGEDPGALASHFIETLEADLAALRVLPPHVAPRVTTHIPQIIALIESLIAKGFAYASDGDVYYAVKSFEGYGKLSGRTLDGMLAGESGRVEESEQQRKKHPLDFALWKAQKAGEPDSAAWESPWGKGRPGWHIECSAMSEEHLGTPFDIHGGGKDLLFPHHENEIAQSEAASGHTLARYWMHNGYLNSVFVDENGERQYIKMSKSLGNFHTIEDILRRHDAETFRYLCLGTHYRQDINFEIDYDQENKRVRGFPSLDCAAQRVVYGYETLRKLNEAIAQSPEGGQARLARSFASELQTAMDDDFNTSQALGVFSDLLRTVNEIVDRKEKPALPKADRGATLRALREELAAFSRVFGILDGEPVARLRELRDHAVRERGIDAGRVETLLQQRAAARAAKDFATGDALKAELLALGVQLQDKPGNVTEWSVCWTV
jgi:cysteinyl-tRNA synthetase